MAADPACPRRRAARRAAALGVSDRVLANEPDVLSHRILRGVDDEDELLGTKFVVYSE